MNHARRRQRGVTAIVVLVLVSLLALLGVYMSTQITGAALGTTLSLNGIQAYFAARSGAEWGIHEALNGSCAASTGLTIDGYPVTVTCSSVSVTEGPDTYNVFTLSSTAERGADGDLDHIYRSISLYVTDAP